ncbi:MAG: antibiotic biosynthesis monooxygenase, partial [Candidatus Competibacteraceae bacterium]|nr:antibiotic biosynthesis monooxygenase [Candidatus Competibacteraceae bacterium]
TLRVMIPATLRSQLISSIGALLQPTRVQPGCLSCRLYIDYDDENAITLIGEWSSRGELTRYLESDVRKTLVAALDLSTEMPQVRIDTIIRKEDLSIIGDLDNIDQSP